MYTDYQIQIIKIQVIQFLANKAREARQAREQIEKIKQEKIEKLNSEERLRKINEEMGELLNQKLMKRKNAVPHSHTEKRIIINGNRAETNEPVTNMDRLSKEIQEINKMNDIATGYETSQSVAGVNKKGNRYV